MADFICDASEMRTLAREVGKADKASRVAFYAGLETGGHLVAARAAQNIAPYSKKIPSTLRVRRRGTVVKISAGGGGAAPNAAPFEHHGRPGKFRHPVFGNREVWRDQEAHPFLVPAAHQMEAAVVAVVDHAIVTAFHRLGF